MLIFWSILNKFFTIGDWMIKLMQTIFMWICEVVWYKLKWYDLYDKHHNKPIYGISTLFLFFSSFHWVAKPNISWLYPYSKTTIWICTNNLWAADLCAVLLLFVFFSVSVVIPDSYWISCFIYVLNIIKKICTWKN